MTETVFETLLSERDENGQIPRHPYNKWRGTHWVLVQLADLGHPAGDKSLVPLREQELKWLLASNKNVKKIAGKYRVCASLEGNALYSLYKLGLADERCDVFVERLLEWQWPDGGWNCDKNPKAKKSSFHESLIPIRGLNVYYQQTGEKAVKESIERAAEILLKRCLYKKQSTGKVIKSDFIKLHYPPYWHYDFLFGLKVMAEIGFINDLRCQDALDLLESKRLPDGGFPSEGQHYSLNDRATSSVDWGGTNQKKANPWVTRDAEFVLTMARR